MCNEQRYGLALSFWTASFQYLMLAKNVSRETASHDNIWVMVRDFDAGPITPEEYMAASRWSDHTIIIPLLFNLLHGTELLVKGFLLVDPNETIERRHNICGLCDRFRNKYPQEVQIIHFFDKYIHNNNNAMPGLLQRFLSDNGIRIEQLYQALRYPSPDFSTMRTYASLKYRGEEGTVFFTELHSDIEQLRVASVRLGRALETKK